MNIWRQASAPRHDVSRHRSQGCATNARSRDTTISPRGWNSPVNHVSDVRDTERRVFDMSSVKMGLQLHHGPLHETKGG